MNHEASSNPNMKIDNQDSLVAARFQTEALQRLFAGDATKHIHDAYQNPEALEAFKLDLVVDTKVRELAGNEAPNDAIVTQVKKHATSLNGARLDRAANEAAGGADVDELFLATLVKPYIEDFATDWTDQQAEKQNMLPSHKMMTFEALSNKPGVLPTAEGLTAIEATAMAGAHRIKHVEIPYGDLAKQSNPNTPTATTSNNSQGPTPPAGPTPPRSNWRITPVLRANTLGSTLRGIPPAQNTRARSTGGSEPLLPPAPPQPTTSARPNRQPAAPHRRERVSDQSDIPGTIAEILKTEKNFRSKVGDISALRAVPADRAFEANFERVVSRLSADERSHAHQFQKGLEGASTGRLLLLLASAHRSELRSRYDRPNSTGAAEAHLNRTNIVYELALRNFPPDKLLADGIPPEFFVGLAGMKFEKRIPAPQATRPGIQERIRTRLRRQAAPQTPRTRDAIDVDTLPRRNPETQEERDALAYLETLHFERGQRQARSNKGTLSQRAGRRLNKDIREARAAYEQAREEAQRA